VALKETPSQLLTDGCAMLGIAVDENKVALFMTYLKEMRSWNERFNLTSITDEHEIIIKHFLDSLALLGRFDIPQGCTVIDIGSGAGLPGVPLKIIRPDIDLVLLESSHKKGDFLRHIIDKLGLKKTKVVTERAEDFGQKEENRDHFCLAVSRAVANFVILLEYALPLLKNNGHLISYKAKAVREELSESEYALNLLGGCIEEVTKVVIPFLSAERYLVSVKKVAPSPKAYPRRAGVPAKKPLLK